MKPNVKTKILIALGILFALIPIIAINLSFISEIREICSENSDDNNLDNKNLEISTLSGKIHIDDNDPSFNWSVAKDAGICSGNGTYSNPYIIEDLEIDGGYSGSCILIANSDVYFKIENCTVYNSGDSYSSNDAGILLYNTTNGALIDNECSSNYYGIRLYSSDNITALGNTANNNGESGIWLYRTDNGTLTGNECSSNIYGIWIDIGDYSTILGNIANNNHEAGILIQSSDHCTILGNTANNNLEAGIWIQYSDYNIVSGNIMNECGLRLQGSLYSLASINIDDTNQVNGKILCYYANVVNLGPANFANAGQVILFNCSHSLISNLNISYASVAISLFYGANNKICKNTLNNNERGIDIYRSHNYTVTENTLTNNEEAGIYLFLSNYNTITANTLTNNGEAGIYLHWSNYNNISGNNANNNDRSGIYLSYCDYNTISGNMVNNNNQYGIYLYSTKRNTVIENEVNYNGESGIFLDLSNYNDILENIANNNTFGIRLFCSDKNTISDNTIMENYYGIYLHAFNTLCGPCDTNRIYDNAFNGNGEDIFSTTDYIDNTLPNEPSFNLIISIIFLFIGGSLIIGLIVSKSRVKH